MQNQKRAFTLAEILITLTVLGVVAGMTLPALINKIYDIQYDRARERVLLTIGEAGRILAIKGEISSGTDAEDFVKTYLSKQLKIVKFCDSFHLSNCGLPDNFKILDGSKTINMLTKSQDLSYNNVTSHGAISDVRSSDSYGFLLSNGYSINLFYNPGCINENNKKLNNNAPDYVCFNAIYDMNGKRKPNQFGKDIGFVTVLYPSETTRAVAPNPAPVTSSTTIWDQASITCSKINKEYILPDKEELLAMVINGKLIEPTGGNGGYWSSSIEGHGKIRNIWTIFFVSGYMYSYDERNSFYIQCIKK